MELAPIILFVYNRIWHTKQTVTALERNELASRSELFIYSDNAKNSEDRKKVEEIRKYIKTIKNFKKITIIEQKKNIGLANSIISGVTKIVNKYGKIIVVEDDLVTSPHFLRFMNESLDLYKNEKKVWHITGYRHPLDDKKIKKHFFIKPATCWGWATWSNRWSYFKKDTDYFLDKFNKKSIKDFNINNTFDYYYQLTLNHKNEINTWAIFWYATTYFNNGLCLHPKKSFVQNIGNDDSGVHCQSTSVFDVELELNYENSFPNDIVFNEKNNKILGKYYKTLKKPIHIRIINKIKKIMGTLE